MEYNGYSENMEDPWSRKVYLYTPGKIWLGLNWEHMKRIWRIISNSRVAPDTWKIPKKLWQSTGVCFVRGYFTGPLGFLILFQHRITFIYMLQTIQACSKWFLRGVRWYMGGTGGYRRKPTPGECAMVWVLVESVCVI